MKKTGEHQDYISLKWGTLKACNLHSEKGQSLLRRYFDLGTSAGAITANDDQEQKELICQMIDECNAPTIYLAWEGIDVPKDEAKRYVTDYGKPQIADDITSRKGPNI